MTHATLGKLDDLLSYNTRSGITSIPNFPQTISSASDISRMISGSKAWPARNGRIGMPFSIAAQ
jgi:hypothetical protein